MLMDMKKWMKQWLNKWTAGRISGLRQELSQKKFSRMGVGQGAKPKYLGEDIIECYIDNTKNGVCQEVEPTKDTLGN